MSYKKRIYEKEIEELSKFFKIVCLVGARQVGKSSLLEHIFTEYQAFVFDPVQDLYSAKKDPDLFLNNFKPPLILDEIQFAPELLPSLKRKVDTLKMNGQYFMTGSQQFSILKNISESLAGRLALIKKNPMIPQEMWSNFDQKIIG